MISYRFKRRAFMIGDGRRAGAQDHAAQHGGCRPRACDSPPRLLVTHWPVGIVAGSSNVLWSPTSGSVGGSPGLQPFADAGPRRRT